MNTTNPQTTDVLVVGAGPTGLTAALVLAQSGVRVRVVERDVGPITESRALWVHSRTLELWDKLGVLESAFAQGKKTNRIDLLLSGKPKGYIPYQGGELSPYPYGLMLEQSKTQPMLVDGLADHGGTVEWGTTLEGFTQNPDGSVTCTLLRHDGTTERVGAHYLVAADGARSHVREALGLSFTGSTHPTAFFLADVEMDWALGHDRIYVNMTNEHFFAFLPMYEEKWFRLIGSLTTELSNRFGPGQQVGEKSTLDVRAIEDHINRYSGLKVRVYSGLKVRVYRANWTSVYRIHTRVADRFRVGNVFLAGDAAHVHSPAGGQGMNTGIGDAFNLAWKLAAVVKGEMPVNVLDSYQAERLPVARLTQRRSDKIFEIEAATNPIMQRFKPLIIGTLSSFFANTRAGRVWIFNFLSQIGVGYPESPAVETADEAKEVRAGERAPYGFLEQGGAHVSLFELFRGVEHQLLFFEGTEARSDFDERCREAQAVTSYVRLSAQPVKVRANNVALHKAYGVTKPTVFLVRPDGHIGYRGALSRPDLLIQHLRRFYRLNPTLLLTCPLSLPLSPSQP